MLGPELFVIHTPEMNRVLGNGTDAFVLAWIDFRVNSEKNGEVYERDGVHWWRLTTEALAEECGFSYGVTRKSVERLTRDGFLLSASHGVRGISDRAKSYRLSEKARPSVQSSKRASVQSDESRAVQSDKSSFSLKEEVTTSGFDEWWSAYPRKIAKPDALKKYKAALGKTTEQVLLSAVSKLAAEWVGRPRADLKFCPHPATWLNQERWNDYAVSTAGLDAAIAEGSLEKIRSLTAVSVPAFDAGDVSPAEAVVARRLFVQGWAEENYQALVEGLK